MVEAWREDDLVRSVMLQPVQRPHKLQHSICVNCPGGAALGIKFRPVRHAIKGLAGRMKAIHGDDTGLEW